MDIDPEKMAVRDRYGLLISVIAPRPIAWVSTVGPTGIPNLAPFSFFTGITANPMTLCFAPVNSRDGLPKDTLVNIRATKQFIVNIVSEALAEKMNQTSAAYPYGVNEFKEVGLTEATGTKVNVPRVKESPVGLECELLQIVTIGSGPLGGNLVIGKVVHIHMDDVVWNEGAPRHQDIKAIGRMEGAWYSRTGDAFELPRPKDPPK